MKKIMIGNKLRDKKIACGENEKTLIIASIGTSEKTDSLEAEISKAKKAQELGANVVTDHSFYGDIPNYQINLCKDLDILVSSVGCYEFAANHKRALWKNTDPDKAIEYLQLQAERGIDMITIHASLDKEQLSQINKTSRLIPTTSKGGGIVASYMQVTERENPYYEFYDKILEIFKTYKVTISLGTTFRPATVCDSLDKLMLLELRAMGKLVERALNAGVNVMIEGLGHATIDTIPTHINIAKKICHQVPYRVLPMAIDTGLGFDHISGAIGAAVAVANGADAITCMSRAEHIGLPTLADMEEAIICSKIAAKSGELVKLRDFSNERQISKTRWNNGCKGDWQAAVNPEQAKQALISYGRFEDQLIQCGMCGDFCGIASGLSASKKERTNEKD